MKLRDLRTVCLMIVVLNGVLGPLLKLGIGYENLPYILVWPRMWFAFGVGCFWGGLVYGEHRTKIETIRQKRRGR